MTPFPWSDVAIIAVLILLNGAFALSELAIVSARGPRLQAAEKRGSRGAKIARQLAADPGRFLSTVQVGITLIGIVKQGPVGFFKHFVPEGLPFFIVPLMLMIELVSYLSRPFSLGIRLAANIAAGHTLMHVMETFVAPLALFGIAPIAFLVFMNGLEFFVAALQAYVFTLLSCMYLSEALADHH